MILGASFDTRALRLKETPEHATVHSFEIDTQPMLAFKREKLTSAGIDMTGVTFVPANFEKDDWLTRLINAGFDPSQQEGTDQTQTF